MCISPSSHPLQSLDSPNNLSDLVGFGHASVVLDIDPGVATPGCRIDSVACASLARLSEISVAYPGEFGESDASGIAAKPLDDFARVFHGDIISAIK